MQQYKDLISHILTHGHMCENRTGISTKSVFGYQMRFDLNQGFPAVTTKKLAWKSVVAELLWFLEGSTDERRLAELTYRKSREELVGKSTIWTANADNQGVALGHYNDEYIKELGPIYGFNWRRFDYYSGSVSGVDQIQNVINLLKQDPNTRRAIVSSWNPLVIDDMSLPPCHTMFHFRVIGGKLNCQLYQRSADVGLGVPFNIASYALLTHIIAKECGFGVGDYVHTIGDAHIYENHFDAMEEVLRRTPLPLPSLKVDDSFDLYDRLIRGFDLDDTLKFTLENYNYYSNIQMDMAI